MARERLRAGRIAAGRIGALRRAEPDSAAPSSASDIDSGDARCTTRVGATRSTSSPFARAWSRAAWTSAPATPRPSRAGSTSVWTIVSTRPRTSYSRWPAWPSTVASKRCAPGRWIGVVMAARRPRSGLGKQRGQDPGLALAVVHRCEAAGASFPAGTRRILRASISARRPTRSMPERRHLVNISVCSSTTWWVMYSPSTFTLAS